MGRTALLASLLVLGVGCGKPPVALAPIGSTNRSQDHEQFERTLAHVEILLQKQEEMARRAEDVSQSGEARLQLAESGIRASEQVEKQIEEALTRARAATHAGTVERKFLEQLLDANERHGRLNKRFEAVATQVANDAKKKAGK